MNKIKKSIVLILCVSLFAALAMGSGSSSDSSATKVGEVSSKDDSAKSETKAEDRKESSDSKNDKQKNTTQSEYHVGDTLIYNGLNITYVSSNYFESDNEFIKPSDGNRFIRLYFYVDNKSGSDKSVTTFDFKCYADGYDCAATYQDDDISATLSDGRSGEGAVYFEVPADATEIEIEYDLDWISGDKAKFIFEGDKDSGLVFEKSASASEETFSVGDVIETKNLKITYLKAEEYVSDNMFMQPADGNKYIYIELEVENLSDSDQMISSFSFECYADGSNCSGFYGLDDSLSATLSSGRKAKGTVAFEVPQDAKTIEIEFEDNFWTQNKIVFLYSE